MKQTPFSIELGTQLNKRHVAVAWLARKANVPKSTISKWFSPAPGRIPKTWHPIVKVARALELTQDEADRLLASAGKPSIPSISELKRSVTDSKDVALLGYWQGPFTVPPAPGMIVGRDETIAQVMAILTRDEKRFCLLQGMGGVGKTAVALHVAHALRDQFVDGVLWADLQEDSPDRLQIVLTHFAQVYQLDVPNNLSVDALSQQVRTALAGRNILIVLDNVQTGMQIDAIRPSGDQIAMLFTARPRTINTPFRTKQLQLMPFSKETTATLDLFREHLGDERVMREEAIFVEIADLIGHLPLAATIVARKLNVEDDWRAADFLEEELRPEKERLATLELDNLSVRLSFNVSYQSLPPPRQRYFADLGVFEGQPFSVDAAAHILDLPLRKTKSLLRELNHRALVQKVDTGRYQLHSLLSQYAHDFLSGRERYVRKVKYYVDYAQTHQYDDGALLVEQDNIRLALKHAHENHIDQPFAQGVVLTYRYLFDHGLRETAQTYLTHALPIARQSGQDDLTAQLLTGLGHIAVRSGEREKAQQFVDQAQALAKDETRPRIGRLQGEIQFYTGGDALGTLNNALALARKHDQVEEIIRLCHTIAAVQMQTGNLDVAAPLINEALNLTKSVGDIRMQSYLLNLQGSLFDNQGAYGEAESTYQHALRLAHKINDPSALVNIYARLSYVERMRGRYNIARDYCEIAQAKLPSYTHTDYRFVLWAEIAAIHTAQGNYKEARRLLEEGFSVEKKHESSIGRIDLFHQLGVLEMQQQNWGAAKTALSESLRMANEEGSTEQIIHPSIALGNVYMQTDEMDTAETHFTVAFDLAEASQYAAETELSRYGLARVAYMRGEREIALERATQSYEKLKKMEHFQTKGVQVWLRQVRGE